MIQRFDLVGLVKNLSGENTAILSKALDAYPTMQVQYADDFSNGLQGWGYHNQYALNLKRYSPTLSKTAKDGYSMALYNNNVQSAETWGRKSKGALILQQGLKKVIMGCEWATHGWWKYAAFRHVWAMDFQIGSTRKFSKIGYVWSSTGSNFTGGKKWQYCSGGDDTPVWTDIPGASEDIPWNEPYKEMWGQMYWVFDIASQKYEKLYSNGYTWDLTGLSIGTGTTIGDYTNGFNHILWNQNRSTGTTLMNAMYINSIFTGYVY